MSKASDAGHSIGNCADKAVPNIPIGIAVINFWVVLNHCNAAGAPIRIRGVVQRVRPGVAEQRLQAVDCSLTVNNSKPVVG